MSDRVIVIGAGVAGLAAAWSARRAGCEVSVVNAGAGASALGSGAVDDLPWEQIIRGARALGVLPKARPLPRELAAFARELGLWDLPVASRAELATVAGRIRPARGRDRALLDLEPLAGSLVILPRVDRASWDADALAASLGSEPFARAHRMTFAAVDLPVLRYDDERRIPDGDLASRHDADARLGWLSERLREGLERVGRAGAILLGPWLGARAPRAEALSRTLGVPVGEALMGVGSPAGLRFEAARDRLFAELGVANLRDRVSSVDLEAGLSVTLEHGKEPLEASSVVLAIGGLVGGGVIYAPPEHAAGRDLPPRVRPPFTLSLTAPLRLSSQSANLSSSLASLSADIPSSMSGPELDMIAWPNDGRTGALESAGVHCDGVRADEGFLCAGDVIAGRPRTVLEAVSSGLLAGVSARRSRSSSAA